LRSERARLGQKIAGIVGVHVDDGLLIVSL
jgi:hypothetical protein